MPFATRAGADGGSSFSGGVGFSPGFRVASSPPAWLSGLAPGLSADKCHDHHRDQHQRGATDPQADPERHGARLLLSAPAPPLLLALALVLFPLPSAANSHHLIAGGQRIDRPAKSSSSLICLSQLSHRMRVAILNENSGRRLLQICSACCVDSRLAIDLARRQGLS